MKNVHKPLFVKDSPYKQKIVKTKKAYTRKKKHKNIEKG